MAKTDASETVREIAQFYIKPWPSQRRQLISPISYCHHPCVFANGAGCMISLRMVNIACQASATKCFAFPKRTWEAGFIARSAVIPKSSDKPCPSTT